MTLIRVEVPDDVFDALVRNDAPDKQDVRPVVVVLLRDQIVRRQIEVREIGNDRQHARGIEPQRFELLAIELGVAKRQVDARRVDAELAATLEALLDELLVHVDEELGRRDVVVDENLAIGKRVGDARRARADREVMNQDVRRVALLRSGRGSRASGLRGAGRRSERRCRTRIRRREARAGCRALRGRWHRRSRGLRGPGGFSALSIQHRSEWQLRQHVAWPAAGRLRRFASQPGSGSMPLPDAPLASSSFKLRQDIEVLLLDDRPRIVLLKEPAAILAERGVQPAALGDRAKRFDELRLRFVIQARPGSECTGRAALRTSRWRAPACRAPRLRARPSRGSHNTTASAADRPRPARRTCPDRRETRDGGCADDRESAASPCRSARAADPFGSACSPLRKNENSSLQPLF